MTADLLQRRPRLDFGRIIPFFQAFVDGATVFVCFLCSYWFYTIALGGWSPQSLPQFAGIAFGAALLYVFILDREGLYRREVSLLNVTELRGISHVAIYSAAIILSLSFYIRFISLSRIMFTTALVISPIVLYLERQLFYRLHLRFHRRGWSQKRVLIYGAGNIGIQLAKRMFESPLLGLLPIGFLDDETSKHGQALTWRTGPRTGLRILGGEDVLFHCERLNVELVFIALPSASFHRNQKLVELCTSQGVDYAIVPNAYEKFVQDVESFEIGGIPILRRRQDRASYTYLFLKRLIDLVLATAAIVLLSPLVLLIGIAIRWESPGPVIFKQKRVGLRGREFTLYKFRSMLIDSPKFAPSPLGADDKRLTKVGRWIRRTSLDELPQLFNVFRGDMSMVGPRPEMPFIVASYTPLERKRLDAKPGITGVWQISAVRGEPIHANLEYDLFYLENRSILLDFAIVVKTGVSVIRGIGAI